MAFFDRSAVALLAVFNDSVAACAEIFQLFFYFGGKKAKKKNRKKKTRCKFDRASKSIDIIIIRRVDPQWIYLIIIFEVHPTIFPQAQYIAWRGYIERQLIAIDRQSKKVKKFGYSKTAVLAATMERPLGSNYFIFFCWYIYLFCVLCVISLQYIECTVYIFSFSFFFLLSPGRVSSLLLVFLSVTSIVVFSLCLTLTARLSKRTRHAWYVPFVLPLILRDQHTRSLSPSLYSWFRCVHSAWTMLWQGKREEIMPCPTLLYLFFPFLRRRYYYLIVDFCCDWRLLLPTYCMAKRPYVPYSSLFVNAGELFWFPIPFDSFEIKRKEREKRAPSFDISITPA